MSPVARRTAYYWTGWPSAEDHYIVPYHQQLSESDKEDYLQVGCKFAGRCPQVMEICKREPPQDIDVDGAQVKCHLFRSSS